MTQDLEGFEAPAGQSNQAALEPIHMTPSRTTSQNRNTATPIIAQPTELAHVTAAARPVAEGHAHSRQIESAHSDALSDLAEILAAQPLRSASSAALLSHHPHAQQTPQSNTAQVQVIDQPPKDIAMPIAEGTEANQPAKPSPGVGLKSGAKMGLGFMSGASTGRGAASKAPVAENAAASAGQADQHQQESESTGPLHEGHTDDGSSMQR